MLATWQANQERIIQYGATVFRRLLDALARPGTIQQIPAPAALGSLPLADELFADAPMNPYVVGAFATLVDRETSFALALGDRWLDDDTTLAHWLGRFTGARQRLAATANFALCLDGASGALLTDLMQGTDAAPEESATAFISVTELGAATVPGGTTLELRGPGIRDAATLAVVGLPVAALQAIHATRQAYPLGVDVVLIDQTGRCVGLPRSTRLTLLATEER